MHISKPSKAVDELYKGWLIYSPNVSSERDGPYESYHGNGQLWQKGTYVADERDGPYESYHESGQLCLRGTYNMGVKCGEWIEGGKTVTYPPC